MTGQTYDQIPTQFARSYEFIMRNDGLGIQLRIQVIGAMLLVDWLDWHLLSQYLNLLDC